ncbi:voltage-dependent calcium channel subunit alpha-2/delta-3 [Euwallacea similis]|uniref:voltage-dependent calcium channel subunit alpha-2/delta-3 n=1 Tax=Euwallacea similis TaxID=1736056 RepID=UPI0034508351
MVLLVIILLALVGPAALEQDEEIPHNEVRNWALQFGVGLWEYGKMKTKMNELHRKYRDVDTAVNRKDGLILIREMALEVKNMMDFKKSAVLRIMDSAEQAALAWRSDNAVLPPRYYNAERLNAFAPDGRPADGTRELVLTPNPHFDHLPVNVSFSTVLTPSRVYDTDVEVGGAIQWSAHLDPLFVSNYEGDPSLAWQFFGSSTGFLRRYPGIAWPPEDLSTLQDSQAVRRPYDFRSSSWYIGAATSPKDLTILLDASGSMAGHRANLARATVEAILDTLTDNDFVNILKFSDTTLVTLPCFKDQLVQATQENIRWLKDSLGTIKQENIANLSSALSAGFDLLQKYNRSGQGCQCNQAIMLVTDGPPLDYDSVFNKYNFPHKPVRVFTYLMGSDSGAASQLHRMACSNRGFYSRIENYESIRSRVLHYIEVLARPMVMYQNDHPIHWTPAYVGGRADSFSDDKIGQLMTTVSTPVFDRRNHSVRVANLLGIVGTDVSIDEIKKLVPPYKLGVNGYSFIVNNNGHILYHPNLKPPRTSEKYEQSLEPQYLSVDLSEVELIENENGPRENHSALLDLRQDMINQKEGETELTLKIHYDDMKRVTTRRYKYFYNSIEGTPFSLGLAIPEGYGMYELAAEQEIKHSQKNVTDYFKGTNWRVHPDWVYCEYTSGTSGEQWFKTAEERVLHFLSRSRRPGWKWMSLRPRSSPLQREHHHFSMKQDKDAYYCDKTLVQSLVMDAMVTESLEKHRPRMDDHPIGTLLVQLQSQGYDIFSSTTSFVATRSGLLRWINFTNTHPDEPPFGQNNARAIDESWYQRAVDQHAVEPESFVFSVPFADGPPGSSPVDSVLLTATHAVFIESKGHRAPAAVVGVQYMHSSIAAHFHNITSKCTSSCKKTCASDKLDCYVLDNNGFIIISENNEHTGRFFGQIDGTIMDSLVQDRIYKKVAVYDYQGSCSNSKNPFSGSAVGLEAYSSINLVFKFVIHTLFMFLTKLNTAYGTALAYSQEEEDSNYDFENYDSGDDLLLNEQNPVQAPPAVDFVPLFESDPLDGVDLGQWGTRPCDRKVDLYALQAERLNTSGQSNPLKGKLTNCHVTGCERPFSVQKIPHSNLILLAVDTLCPCGSKQLSIMPQELAYESKEPSGCIHRPRANLYRKKPPKCINYHPEEIEIKICGKGTTLMMAKISVFLCAMNCLLAFNS